MEPQYQEEAPCSRCGALRKKINGPWLRARRLKSGFGLRALARQIDTTPQLLCDIEHNRCACPPRILVAYEALCDE